MKLDALVGIQTYRTYFS